MNLISVIANESGGGAQAVSREMVKTLGQNFKAREYILFKNSDYSLWYPYKWATIIWRAFAEFRSFFPQVVISHLDSSLFATSILKRFIPFKLIHVFHGPPTRRSGFRGHLYEYFKRSSLIRADGLIFVSSEQMIQHHVIYPELAHIATAVIPNPFFERLEKCDESTKSCLNKVQASGRRLWLLPGRLSVQKNQIFALKTFGAWLQSGRRGVLLLAGDGEDSGVLIQQVQQLGMSWSDSLVAEGTNVADVVFLGHRFDIQDLMQKVDLVVLPSLFEGYPLALVEALCVGARVVAANCPTGPSEIFSEYTRAVDPFRPESNFVFRLLPAQFDEQSALDWNRAIDEVISYEPSSLAEINSIKTKFGKDKFSLTLNTFVKQFFQCDIARYTDI